MGLRSVLASFLTVFAAAAAADSLRFDPPVATGHTSVDAIFSTIGPGCLLNQQGMTVSGTAITLRISTFPPGGGCLATTFALTSTFHLGVLAPGVYDVVGIADGVPTARTKLIVRDDSLTIAPFAVSTSGGEFRILHPSGTTGRVVVLVDGRVATPVRSESDGDVYLAPPHAPGTVDVSVTSASTFRTAVAALTYFDRAVPPDPALFELILFPTSFEGAGGFGARWTTDNYIAATEDQPVRFRDSLPCFLCTDTLTTPALLRNDQNPAGLALFALRGTTSQLMTGSRMRDVSRQAQNGTQVTVVRESDLRDRGMYFLTVPVDRQSRVMLRAWALTDVPVAIPGSTPPKILQFFPLPGTPLAFATLDLTSYFQQLPAGSLSAFIYFPRYAGLRMWGMISVANNDTQQVTISSPQ